MTKPITNDVLRRLTTEGLSVFLGQAPRAEILLRQGCASILSGEPVADLNCVVVGPGAELEERFATTVETCKTKEIPFLAMLFPEAPESLAKDAEELGLVNASGFPFMVRGDAPSDVSGARDVEVVQAGGDDVREWSRVLSLAFGMPEESVARALPAAWADSPGLDVYLARRSGRAIGSVTLTHHGDTAGVWAMGTDPQQQGTGAGRRLLSAVMAAARERGTRRFFLGATPAGFPLYERLGYQTRCTAQIWVSGSSTQV